MEESFPSQFSNEHEILFYEGQGYHNKNAKDKTPLMIKHQDMMKESITSPEFNLFHMTSPDLERLIVGQPTTSETTTTNGRETTTISSSDLNVLNLVSPDFEKIFSNFNAGFEKDSNQREDFNKRRSVEKQHEVYTKTFVDALRKSQGQMIAHRETSNSNTIDTSRENIGQHENKIYSFNNQKGPRQFSLRNKSEHHLFSGQDVRVQRGNDMHKFTQSLGNFREHLPFIEDRNRNKIGIRENHRYGNKTGSIEVLPREDGNRNAIRQSNYGNLTNPLILDNHICNRDESDYGHTGVNLLEDRNRNTIQAGFRNQNNPNQSEPTVNHHPELFKLHAHVKLSENLREYLERKGEIATGHQEVHTGPQIFPLPPIDLQVQEIVKRERKKQKNRVAASKCRKKKLEREAQLEVTVQQLRERNIELTAIATALRSQVTDLKQRVVEHIASGCHVAAVTLAY